MLDITLRTNNCSLFPSRTQFRRTAPSIPDHQKRRVRQDPGLRRQHLHLISITVRMLEITPSIINLLSLHAMSSKQTPEKEETGAENAELHAWAFLALPRRFLYGHALLAPMISIPNPLWPLMLMALPASFPLVFIALATS